MMAILPSSKSSHRIVVVLCTTCFILILSIITLKVSSTSEGEVLSSLPKLPYLHHKLFDALQTSMPENGSEQVANLGYSISDWKFDVNRDGRDFGLSDEQCARAFPNYFYEIDRAVAWRKQQSLPNIKESQLNISWRKEGEIVRAMIYDRQLHIIDYKFAAHGYDIPRALALLQEVHRAIIAYHGSIPNIEFSMSLGDWSGDSEAKWPMWVLTRRKIESDKWVMPDFGYWSWPLDVVGDYTQFRRDVSENEVLWEEKIKKAVWRGATDTNKLREDLIKMSKDRSWSDVHSIEWVNMTTMTDESYQRALTMANHCKYQFLIHTEGHSYSGRGKYLLNCESVSVVHVADWIESHTHLMVGYGPQQNIVQVKRDFSDLNKKMDSNLKAQDQSKLVAQRSAAVFRDLYLTPAAQACYWRRLFKAWASVSFEPQQYFTTRDSAGNVQRKSRGIPFETFVAGLVMPATPS